MLYLPASIRIIPLPSHSMSIQVQYSVSVIYDTIVGDVLSDTDRLTFPRLSCHFNRMWDLAKHHCTGILNRHH